MRSTTGCAAGWTFAVCYCDIDGFKAVNDAYGFARGDEFIVTLARKLLRRGRRGRAAVRRSSATSAATTSWSSATPSRSSR